MSHFIDLTRPLQNDLPVWPGDRSVHFEHVARIRDGSIVNIGNLALSVHNGTHADAPYHYNDAGVTIDRIPIETYVGPAQVIDVRGHPVVSIKLLQSLGAPAAPRLLLRTGCWTDPQTFPQDWTLLDLDAPAWLAANGVRLIGLDAPSVDALTSEDLPRHLACDRAGVLILENLLLDDAPTGIHELIALPLKLRGGDGSPIRAVLRCR